MTISFSNLTRPNVDTMMAMKVSLLLLSLVWSADATCTADDTPCQPNSGVCSSAVALGLPPTSDLGGAVNALSYGKFCGGNNKCQPTMMADETDENQCESGTDGCPPEPCDEVDAACATHDACLDTFIAMNPETEIPIPVPERCQCDVVYISNLAAVASTGNATGLCDAEFYTALVNIFQNEATLLAAPHCCNVLKAPEDNPSELFCGTDAEAEGYEQEFVVAQSFCTTVLQTIETAFGVNVCAPSGENMTFPVCDICPDDMEVSLPNATLPTGQTCAEADAAGKAGGISEEQCAAIKASQAAISNICGCIEVTSGAFCDKRIITTAAGMLAAFCIALM